MIIDSISAISGGRLSKDSIKIGENSAFVEACFFNEDGEDIILTREFYQNGRNICKINGEMTTLSKFKEFGEKLIDIHGQHDNQSLLNEKTHINLLDSFAGKDILNLKSKYTKLLDERKNIMIEIDKNFGNPLERARRIDLLKYQNDEITNANLKLNEEEELESRHSLIMNYEKIARALDSAYSLLDTSSIESLSSAIFEINNISKLDKKYEEILNSLNDAYYSLKDTSSEVAKLINDTEFDENEQKEIEERLDLIFSLKRKYGKDIETILKYNDEIEKEIEYLENSDEIVNKLKIKLENIEINLNVLALQMREIRVKTANIVSKKINEQLQDLEMKKAYLEFEFSNSEAFLENGKDIVQILISTNVGEGLKPLSKIASGGEISRVMLAIKTILCNYDDIPTMIFDEIDTGISGQAGKAVAEKMKIIGKSRQVICVTHLPNIAAAGDANYFIEKIVENDRTKTKVTKLNEKEVITEIARILAGNNITKAVLEHANEIRKECEKIDLA